MFRRLFLVVSILSMLAVSPAFAASYEIDAIYDNVNPTWLDPDNKATLHAGETYDLTVEGYGDDLFIPDFLFFPAQSPVAAGASVDYYGSGPTVWPTFTDSAVISGNTDDVPTVEHSKRYRLNGLFTVPSDVETKEANYYAWFNSNTGNPPENAAESFEDDGGFLPPQLASRFGTVNLVSLRNGGAAIPEPTTLAMVGMGLLGGAAMRRRRKSVAKN